MHLADQMDLWALVHHQDQVLHALRVLHWVQAVLRDLWLLADPKHHCHQVPLVLPLDHQDLEVLAIQAGLGFLLVRENPEVPSLQRVL